MKEQYFGQTYKLKGRNPDRRVTLKPPYASADRADLKLNIPLTDDK